MAFGLVICLGSGNMAIDFGVTIVNVGSLNENGSTITFGGTTITVHSVEKVRWLDTTCNKEISVSVSGIVLRQTGDLLNLLIFTKKMRFFPPQSTISLIFG